MSTTTYDDGYDDESADDPTDAELAELYRLEQLDKLTPDEVVDAARDPDSPLHDRFEWDDRVAAWEYRKTQARALIRRHYVLRDSGDGAPVRVRRFVHVDGRYRSMDRVRANDQWRAEMLERARRDALTFRAKYRALGATALRDVIDDTLDDDSSGG